MEVVENYPFSLFWWDRKLLPAELPMSHFTREDSWCPGGRQAWEESWYLLSPWLQSLRSSGLLCFPAGLLILWLPQEWWGSGHTTPKSGNFAYWVYQAEGIREMACVGRTFWPFPEGHKTFMREVPSLYSEEKSRKEYSYLWRREGTQREIWMDRPC